MASKIQVLPPETAALIKSSAKINDIADVIFGLVKNSLDANSQNLKIQFDCRRGECTVEDNGSGIPLAEFQVTGGLGKSYHTSKFSQKNDLHGFSGTFLSSLSALALVVINSRETISDSTGQLVLHRGQAISRTDSKTLSQDLSSIAHGTKVIVRNLFGDMPVRIKQRAKLDTSFELQQWDKIKMEVLSLLLAWKKPVNLLLHETNGVRRMNIRAASISTNSEPSLHASRQKSILRILTQGGLIEPDSMLSWVPISAKTDALTVRGMISLDPAPTRHFQFISFGVVPISSSMEHKEIYNVINRLFSQSHFGEIEQDTDINQAQFEQRKDDQHMKRKGLLSKQNKVGMKGVDRWPRFWLQIQPGKLFDGQGKTNHPLLEYQTNFQIVVEVIQAMIVHWLKDTYSGSFKRRTYQVSKRISRKSRPNTADNASLFHPSPLSTGLRPVSTLADRTRPFSSWSRIKAGHQDLLREIWSSSKPISEDNGDVTSSSHFRPGHNTSISDLPSQQETAVLRVCPPNKSKSRDSGPSLDHAMQNGDTSNDIIVNYESTSCLWMQPGSKETYHVCDRSGMMRLRDKGKYEEGRATLHTDTRSSSNTIEDSNFSKSSLRNQTSDAVESSWLDTFLKSWNNPVFPTTENQIPTVTMSQNFGTDLSKGRCCSYLRNGFSLADFDKATLSASNKLSAAALQDAEVIAQVDRKFVLVKMPAYGNVCANQSSRMRGRMLVLIDQHAADERCKIETLLRNLCKGRDLTQASVDDSQRGKADSLPLARSIKFLIKASELESFERLSAFFAGWGIVYDLDDNNDADLDTLRPIQQQVLIVKALPPGILKRCVQEPKILIELLRAEIWSTKIRKSGGDATHAETRGDMNNTAGLHPWLSHIGDCPRGMLDLLNSQACRSAIMFNDSLSLGECKTLVHRISQCAFPFQCAHGRPSMIPLLDLGSTPGNEAGCVVGRHDDNNGNFRISFGKWRDSLR